MTSNYVIGATSSVVADDEGHRSISVLAIYLVLTAPLAVVGAWRTAGAGAFAVAHLIAAGAAGAALIIARRRSLPAAAGWITLAAIPFLYADLKLLIAGAGSPLHDPFIQELERRLFGESPAATLAGRAPARALSELLHLGYLSYYPLIYVPPAVAYWRGRRVVFERIATGLMVAFTVCFAMFIVFPVAGPRFLWPAPPGVPDGPVRSLVLTILANGSTRGAAFPSSHVAVAVVQTWMALKWQRPLGWAALAATTMLAVGAIYGGFHYAVDVLAGLVVGLAISTLLFRR